MTSEANLIFVSGKGGVGKTTVSQALALLRSQRGSRVLWCAFEDPTQPKGEQPGEKIQKSPTLWHLNCDGMKAFEEYSIMKIGVPQLTRIFLQNRVTRYLYEAAPGIRELVLLGKVWFESGNFDQVIVDMPSTGYGLAMFRSTLNFIQLFRGGPLHRDAESIFATLKDPRKTEHWIVALPEEMALRESLELRTHLLGLFPENEPKLVVNRRFPPIQRTAKPSQTPDDWSQPFAESLEDYALKRSELEDFNLRLWEGLARAELGFIPPGPPAPHGAPRANEDSDGKIARVAEALGKAAWR